MTMTTITITLAVPDEHPFLSLPHDYLQIVAIDDAAGNLEPVGKPVEATHIMTTRDGVVHYTGVSLDVAVPADDDAGEPACRTCGASYPEAGDGWDGECPECADRTSARAEAP